MQFPESWLREFCNPSLDTLELADLLTMSGMEVEELRPVAPRFTGVVVGEIVSAEPHPQADRLRVCRVDAGPFSPDGPLQIVCGAPNARAGIRVPLATVGAELPPGADGKPFKIGVGKLRGVESLGMLCSAKELHIADDHGGLYELPADAPLGVDVYEWLTLDDVVYTLKLTPNLAHGLSVYGVAREVAALTGAPLLAPPIASVQPANDHKLGVTVQAADLCGRFSGRVVRGINPQAPTPAWMVDRLARCGQRSVTALVDISNYVMFEYGQPSHIFDLDQINGGLVVRWAQLGESLKLLNGNTVVLDEKVGVIADAQHVESLAGIMGGDATAVSDSTANIYIEAAFWWPQAVQGRARRYNFTTDAGHRFERGVDPSRTVAMIERITQLVMQICGGQPGPVDDQTLSLPECQPVTLRADRATRVIGMPVTQAQCADVFRRMGLQFTEGQGTLTVTPPPWRFDLKIEEDLIEEVIRVIGFDKLPTTATLAPVTPRVRREAQRHPRALRRQLVSLGYAETINFSFVEARWETELAGNDAPIRVLNPIAAPLAVMRSSLIGSLVQVLRTNLARRADRVRVFELGRVYLRDAQALSGDRSVAGLHQPQRVAGLAYGDVSQLQWGERERATDFYDIKGDVQALLAPLQATFEGANHPAMHPGRCARVLVAGKAIGFVGELHPRWRQAYELPLAPTLFELDLEAVLEEGLPLFNAVPRQQPVWRDLALVLREGPGVNHDALVAALCADPAGLVQSATLFDVYTPTSVPGGGPASFAPGERSYAVRLQLLDPKLTLTDERIEGVMAAAVTRVRSALGGRLRG